MRSTFAHRAGILKFAMLASLLLAFSGSLAPAAAQPKVYYGEGQYGRYREQLAGYMNREQDLEFQINDLVILDTYCKDGNPSLQDATKQLRALRAAYNQLRSDYNKFKDGMSTLARDYPKQLTGFPLEQTTPENPNFWATADEVMGVANKLLQDKDAELLKAREIDCSEHTTPQTGGGTGGGITGGGNGGGKGPVWPPVSPSQPLDGFVRPKIDKPKLPPMPEHFCTEQQAMDFYDKVFKPLYDRAYQSAHDALGYRADLSHKHLAMIQQIYELEHESKPGTVNPNLLADLHRQADILQAEMDAWEPIAGEASSLYAQFNAMAAALLKVPVIDCTKLTPPPPPPPPPTGGQTGMREPPPLDLRYPHTPDTFCSEGQKSDFLKLMQPIIDRARAQAAAWAAYAALSGNATAAGLAQRAQSYLSALEDNMRKAQTAKIVDCNASHFHFSFGIGIGIGLGGGGHRGDDRRGSDTPVERAPPRD